MVVARTAATVAAVTASRGVNSTPNFWGVVFEMIRPICASFARPHHPRRRASRGALLNAMLRAEPRRGALKASLRVAPRGGGAEAAEGDEKVENRYTHIHIAHADVRSTEAQLQG